MLKSSFEKWLVTVALLIVIAGAVLHFARSPRVAPQQKAAHTGVGSVASGASEFGEGVFHPRYVPSVPRPAKVMPQRNAGFERLSREKVEAWLATHHRNATSLLAAFRALNDTNYLNEAAANFPNNPQVELAVLARDEFPADRRKWLDLFKASSPGNSLANYLSAQDYLKNGNSAAAVQELLAATEKSQFNAYNSETLREAEDLYSSSGLPAREADTLAMSDMAKENLPVLATYKRLARGIGELQQQQHLEAGDTQSAANLADLGMALGNRLKSGDSGKYIINQLVGNAINAIILQSLNPETRYDFLGGKTPAQFKQESKQHTQVLVQTVWQFDKISPHLTDDEMADYYKRVRIYGEIKAMKWVVQQHPPPNH